MTKKKKKNYVMHLGPTNCWEVIKFQVISLLRRGMIPPGPDRINYLSQEFASEVLDLAKQKGFYP